MPKQESRVEYNSNSLATNVLRDGIAKTAEAMTATVQCEIERLEVKAHSKLVDIEEGERTREQLNVELRESAGRFQYHSVEPASVLRGIEGKGANITKLQSFPEDSCQICRTVFPSNISPLFLICLIYV